jgi:tetratricopeptide (TPR) repeat protein
MTNADGLIAELQTANDDADRIRIFGELARINDPLEEARAYEVLSARIAARVVGIIPFCARLSADHNASTEVRIFAAVTGATACRRSRRWAEGRDILGHVRELQRDYPILLHMYALTYRGGEPAELRRGVRAAEEAYAKLPGNPGVAHSLAAFLTDIAYLDAESADNSATLARALELVNEAIGLEPSARFYFTRAKINRKLGRFDDAKADLAIAMENEDPTSVDHRHRIAEYMLESNLVDADRATRHYNQRTKELMDSTEAKILSLDARIDEATARAAGAQLQTISALAFFASLLALIQFTALILGKGYAVGQALAVVAAMAVVIFAAVFLGSWMLRKALTPPPRGESDPRSGEWPGARSHPPAAAGQTDASRSKV